MKIELHAHSKEISSCGKLSVEELLELYRNAGYDGIVLTNHFNRETALRLSKENNGDFEEIFHSAYEKMALLGKNMAIQVFYGYEIRFDGSSNDYLVYGMDRETAKEYDTLFQMTPEKFGTLAKEKGFLFYQAHPFRKGMTIVEPSCLFGMEVKNTHPRHDSRNDMASAWAEKFGLHKIGGSDCHQKQDAAGSGIITEKEISTLEALVAVLREDAYTII